MNIDELRKWEKELNTCIRCGYCYENCHLFRLTGWETDSPRGKMLIIYGMLNDELEPSEDISRKMFECFYCKQCEDNCSANVSVTDIFTDVREFLKEKGFEVDGTTAMVDEDLCSGCGMCVTVCTAEATTMKEENGERTASVDSTKCQACGVCVGTCPSGARELNEGYRVSRKELLEQIEHLLGVKNE